MKKKEIGKNIAKITLMSLPLLLGIGSLLVSNQVVADEVGEPESEIKVLDKYVDGPLKGEVFERSYFGTPGQTIEIPNETLFSDQGYDMVDKVVETFPEDFKTKEIEVDFELEVESSTIILFHVREPEEGEECNSEHGYCVINVDSVDDLKYPGKFEYTAPEIEGYSLAREGFKLNPTTEEMNVKINGSDLEFDLELPIHRVFIIYEKDSDVISNRIDELKTLIAEYEALDRDKYLSSSLEALTINVPAIAKSLEMGEDDIEWLNEQIVFIKDELAQLVEKEDGEDDITEVPETPVDPDLPIDNGEQDGDKDKDDNDNNVVKPIDPNKPVEKPNEVKPVEPEDKEDGNDVVVEDKEDPKEDIDVSERDVNSLRELIKSAENIDYDKYTKETTNELNLALQEARNVVKNYESGKEVEVREIERAYDELSEALESLELKDGVSADGTVTITEDNLTGDNQTDESTNESDQQEINNDGTAVGTGDIIKISSGIGLLGASLYLIYRVLKSEK